MANDDRPSGWVQMFPGRGTRMGQTIRIAQPPTDDRITWPQRPQFRGATVRVKVLAGEAGAFLTLEPGSVVDLPETEAAPRLRDGRVRRARPDESLTNHAIE